MIFTESVLPVVDNAGARFAKVIKSLGRQRNYANIGETILVTITKVAPRKKIKKSMLIKCVIISGNRFRCREYVHNIKNWYWSCILLKRDAYTPRATRIKIPVALELYDTHHFRTLLLAPKII